jgi:hypothetical protein
MSIREILEADRHENDFNPTEIPEGRNQFEVHCEVCGGAFFVDERTFEAIAEAIREGLDNPFICLDCQQEYDELAYA